MSVENGEHSTAGTSEKCPGKHADCTHLGVNRTQNGYTKSRVSRVPKELKELFVIGLQNGPRVLILLKIKSVIVSGS